MRRDTSRKLAMVVRILRLEGRLVAYKQAFKGRWRLLVSHIALTLDSRVSARYLAEAEASLVGKGGEIFKGVFVGLGWQDEGLAAVD